MKRLTGLENVIDIETSTRSADRSGVLSKFNGGRVSLETDTGYMVHSGRAEESIPEIVRQLEGGGAGY